MTEQNIARDSRAAWIAGLVMNFIALILLLVVLSYIAWLATRLVSAVWCFWVAPHEDDQSPFLEASNVYHGGHTTDQSAKPYAAVPIVAGQVLTHVLYFGHKPLPRKYAFLGLPYTTLTEVLLTGYGDVSRNAPRSGSTDAKRPSTTSRKKSRRSSDRDLSIVRRQ